MQRSWFLFVLLTIGAVAALSLSTALGEPPTPARVAADTTPSSPSTEAPPTPTAAAGTTAADGTDDLPVRDSVSTGTSMRLLHGRLTRNGHPVPGRPIKCADRERPSSWDAVTAADGTFSFRLRRGRYAVTVPPSAGRPVALTRSGPLRRRPPSGGLLHAARRGVELGDEDQRLDIDLPTGSIVVRVIDEVTFQPVRGVVVSWRPPPPAQQLLEFDSRSGDVRIDDVADGLHYVSASRRGYSARVSDKFEVRGDTHTIELRMRPVGALDVVLLDASGRAVPITPEHEILIRNTATGRHAEPRNRDAIRDRRRRHEIDRFVYDGLDPGPYRITGKADEYSSDRSRVRFAPCVFRGEESGTSMIEVPRGRVTEARIPVTVRSAVRLQPIDQWGNLTEARLFLEWLDAGGSAVHVSPYPTGVAGYRGYLAPGSYSVRVERDGKIRVERLVVGDDGAPIERGLRIE